MRNRIIVAIAIAVLCGCAHKGKEASSAADTSTTQPSSSTAATTPGQAPAPPPDMGWPRTFVNGGATSKIYQPQLESWDGFALKGTAAVEIDQTGLEPVFGVVHFTTRTTVDYSTRIVKLD